MDAGIIMEWVYGSRIVGFTGLIGVVASLGSVNGMMDSQKV
jgi:hypothetical protein